MADSGEEGGGGGGHLYMGEREERKREERGEEKVHVGSSFQPVASNGLT
jgi:hypothetical protein